MGQIKNIIKRQNRISFYIILIIASFATLSNGCKKDEENTNIVKDIDGNVYHTVTIGNQIWMVENLNVTHFRNGDSIPNITDPTEWSKLAIGVYCDYDNTSRNSSIYGRLYNWYAVNDVRNIAPIGWHVATDSEWTKLEKYVMANTGTSGSAVKVLASNINWEESKTPGSIGCDLNKNNSSGFTALPGGIRYADGTFDEIGRAGNWWCSTEFDVNYAQGRGLLYSSISIYWTYTGYYKPNGFSVRCLKDN